MVPIAHNSFLFFLSGSNFFPALCIFLLGNKAGLKVKSLRGRTGSEISNNL